MKIVLLIACLLTGAFTPAAAETSLEALIAERTVEAAALADASGLPVAFLPNLEIMDLPAEMVFSAAGETAEGRRWQVYDFCDVSPNAALSDYDMTARRLTLMDGEEIYLLFAKAPCGDAVYRRAHLIDGGKLRVMGGTSAAVGLNALKSQGGRCVILSEADVSAFLYWDESAGNFLSAEVWQKEIHVRERNVLNDFETLPQNAAEALAAGFEKLSREEAKYHQLDDSLPEYEQGACLKFVRADGREAVYVIVSPGGEDAIKKDPAATRLLTQEDDPDEYLKVMPTYNYCPGQPGTALADRMSAASIGHYYFDMLPFFWWGSGL